jgi:hypothetical protein
MNVSVKNIITIFNILLFYFYVGQKISYFELLRALEGTLSRWSRLHLQSLAPTNPYLARVVGYGPFSLEISHKESLCPISADIKELIMITSKMDCDQTAMGFSSLTSSYMIMMMTFESRASDCE